MLTCITFTTMTIETTTKILRCAWNSCHIIIFREYPIMVNEWQSVACTGQKKLTDLFVAVVDL